MLRAVVENFLPGETSNFSQQVNNLAFSCSFVTSISPPTSLAIATYNKDLALQGFMGPGQLKLKMEYFRRASLFIMQSHGSSEPADAL